MIPRIAMIPTPEELEEIFNREIARELLMEATGGEVNDELLKVVWAKCSGNPWNAVVMYNLLKISGQL